MSRCLRHIAYSTMMQEAGKGGIRFHPQETIDTIRALSMDDMEMLTVVDIPLGGGKGGVICP